MRWGLVLTAVLLAAAGALAQSEQEVLAARQAAGQAIRERINRMLTMDKRLKLAAERPAAAQTSAVRPQQMGGSRPDYFGGIPYWTNTVPIRKFVDLLPGVNAANANNLGQFIPVAVPDTTTYPGSDYYIIALRQYRERMHSDLPMTKLRGYVQLRGGVPVTPIHYLGPMIIAQKNRPVRVKFINQLPTGAGGDLFLPVDTTTMGAGDGPIMGEMYTQNRAAIHLHGGLTPWISDGTPHQWITPAGEMTMYPRGVSAQNVPDMPDPGDGAVTLFYSNQQSARLMFYHDHAYGITRLNVYAGEAAPYLLQDDTEAQLIADGIIPAEQIPLIIQDKTFVPRRAELAATDPLWDINKWGGFGSLWFPHVYMPNQNPNAEDGANLMGRLDYGPWFWPPWPAKFPPYYDAMGIEQPNLPDISSVMEASMDVAMVNGTAYPICRVSRKAYRFRILNAANDRHLNLGLYYARSNTPDSVDPDTGLPTLQTLSGEIRLRPATKAYSYPDWWGEPDDRDGGLPHPAGIGPPIIQIGTEGGFLPAPVVIPSTPVFFDLDPRSITLNLIKEHGLWLAPAERADVIIDFSRVPDGARLILYNDCPSPAPLPDPRVDYYTNNPDYRELGGAAPTQAGYSPNTRTIMQFEVSGPREAAFNVDRLKAEFASTSDRPGVFARSQDPILVPQAGYNSAYNAEFPKDRRAYVRLHDTSFTFTPLGAAAPLFMQLTPKAIAEEFESTYGRMSAFLGVEVPFTNGWNQTTIFFTYPDPLTEDVNAEMTPLTPVAGDGTQIWKITHNGIDTHPIHFHLFNVQLVNRVDWAGIVIPPDPNELGWKETVRMSAFQDTIVALRPVVPAMPFGVPNSVRLMDPTMPWGTRDQFTGVDPNGLPINVFNAFRNYGWEYVWHCHMLGHEEMDMMRPIKINVPTTIPAAAALSGQRFADRVVLNWVDPTPAASSWGNPANEIGFEIMRDTGDGAFVQIGTARANQVSYVDRTIVPGQRYRYRVRTFNASGKAHSNIVNMPAP